MTDSYSLPLSPEGRANLVPPPPWHYVGDFVVVDYWADPAAVAAVLPPGVEPLTEDAGRAAVIFADWASRLEPLSACSFVETLTYPIAFLFCMVAS